MSSRADLPARWLRWRSGGEPVYPARRVNRRLSAMTRSFFSACVVLWRPNGETRFSLVGTGLFWGAGVTLRFLLQLLWVPVALGITDNATPTYLNAMVAVGIGQ